MITATLVKDLREKTNAGMMDCKKALEETNGDLDAAVKLLREKGIAKAAKKAARLAKEGIITARIDDAAKSGILLEVNCETDFVTKNENFQSFVRKLADVLATSSATDHASASVVPFDGMPLADAVKAKVLEIGENLQFRKFVRFDLQGEGVIASYIHLGGKVGVMIEGGCMKAATAGNGVFRELIKDLTLHIAAAAPKGISRDDIPAEVIESEKEIFRAQLINEGKPEAMLDKILPGKMTKWFAESCLLEQGFVKDPDTTVGRLLEAKGKELGDTLVVRRFVRFGLGE
jgi:elongation factor Ts